MEKRIIRKLYRLAEAVSINAERIRNADKPWQLNRCKARARRQMVVLMALADRWRDTYKPSRRLKAQPLPDGRHWWPGQRYYSR